MKLVCQNTCSPVFIAIHNIQTLWSTRYPTTGKWEEMKFMNTLEYCSSIKGSKLQHLQQHGLWVLCVKWRNSAQKDKYPRVLTHLWKIMGQLHMRVQWNCGHKRLGRTEERKDGKKLYKGHKTDWRNRCALYTIVQDLLVKTICCISKCLEECGSLTHESC